MGAERAGAALLLLRSDQLGARRQRDLERRPEHRRRSRSAAAPTRTPTRSTAPTSARRRGSNTDAIEEVQVLQLGASAEYGNVQGAVFNIVTRQGGNVFHGDAQLLLPERRADRPQHHRRGRPRLPVSPRDLAGRDASRRRARSCWTSSGSSARCSISATGTRSRASTRASRPRTTPRRVFWKFNYNINAEPPADARLSRRLLLHSRHRRPSFTAPSTIDLSHGDNPTPNLVYTGVLSDKTFIEARYSGLLAAQLERSERRPARRACRPRFEDQDTGPITGGIASWAENRSWRYGLPGEAVAPHRELPRRQPRLEGRRAVRRPRQRQPERPERHHTDLQRDRPADDRHHPAAVSPGRATSRWIGAYVDDTYRLGRAIVNLGVRYDYSQGMFPSFPLLDAAGCRPARCRPANDDVYHWNTFSPRVGVNYRLNASGRTLVKAHYGRYYKAMEATEFRPAVPSITPAFEFTLDAAGNRINVVQISSNANLRIDPELQVALQRSVHRPVRAGADERTSACRSTTCTSAASDYGALAGHRRRLRSRCRTSTTSASTRPARR